MDFEKVEKPGQDIVAAKAEIQKRFDDSKAREKEKEDLVIKADRIKKDKEKYFEREKVLSEIGALKKTSGEIEREEIKRNLARG